MSNFEVLLNDDQLKEIEVASQRALVAKKKESKHKIGQPGDIGGYMAGMVSDMPGEPRLDDVENIRGVPEEDKYVVQ